MLYSKVRENFAISTPKELCYTDYASGHLTFFPRRYIIMKGNILTRIVDRIVYSTTKKPRHYVEVRNPPRTPIEKLKRPQDARQMQYNRWSTAHQIYSGSYLPYRMADLKKRGWTTKHPSKNSYESEHIRKSTGQHILRHGRHRNDRGKVEPTHYHWKNPAAEKLSKKQGKSIYYFDKYGDICARGSAESHIKPFRTRRKK